MIHFLDLHYHANPDLYLRKHTVLSLGTKLNNLGGAVVLKSHLGSTVDQAFMAQQMGFPILGSLTLNKIGGGVDYRNVLSSLARYQASEKKPLLVYFPTIKSGGIKKKSKLQRCLCHPALIGVEDQGEPLLEGFKLRPQVVEVLKLSRDWPIRFSTGHSSREEVLELSTEAVKLGIDKMMLTHPAHPCLGFTEAELTDLAKNSLYWFELSALTKKLGHQTSEDFYKCAQLPRTCYVSDFGQTQMVDIDQWYSESKSEFVSAGLVEKTARDLFVNNALAFLGIQEEDIYDCAK